MQKRMKRDYGGARTEVMPQNPRLLVSLAGPAVVEGVVEWQVDGDGRDDRAHGSQGRADRERVPSHGGHGGAGTPVDRRVVGEPWRDVAGRPRSDRVQSRLRA